MQTQTGNSGESVTGSSGTDIGCSSPHPIEAAARLIAAFAHGPLAFILLTAMLSPYALLGPADFILALVGYTVALFASLTACALSGSLSHARAALTMPFYWPLATIAAWRALFELIVRPHHWAKTSHGVSPRTPTSGAPSVAR